MDLLAPDQIKAYDAIMKWLDDPQEWFFTLGGYAGTGKTFLMQHLVNQIERTTVCCAPTGKAAEVLKSKMPRHVKVCTIHHLLYSPIETSTEQKIETIKYIIGSFEDAGESVDEELRNQLRKLEAKLEREGNEDDVDFIHAPHEILESKPLIIVDESSMVTMKMFNDFAMAGCLVLFVGDPFQLPPVNMGDRYELRALFIEHPPQCELTEIKRQALDSPIIRVAHAIRHGENPKKHFVKGECFKVPRSQLRPVHYARAGQVICGTHKTRYGINRDTRQELGHKEQSLMPVKGDKLICVMNKDNYAWINGVIMQAMGDLKQGVYGNPVLDVMYQDELRQGVEMYDYHLRLNYNDKDLVAQYKINDWREKQMLVELDYAYAITCHKSQGSEWDKVLLVQDWFWSDVERWLYTGVTRAKEVLLWAA